MSTRSIIAKPEGDGWEGVYHHWDGYPSGVGVELLTIYRSVFGGDLDAMTKYLIDDEPVGWSTICGADWTQAKGWQDDYDPDAPCAACDQPMWRHYAQYYPEGGPDDPMVNGRRRVGLLRPNEVMQLDHTHQAIHAPKAPQSYSSRGETTFEGRDNDHHHATDEDFSGAEWLYVLTPGGILVAPGDFGAFGMGGGNFRDATLIPWDDVDGMVSVEKQLVDEMD